ncbi:MAG: YcgL domain-containing protein [Pseudoxanthomonas sp.]
MQAYVYKSQRKSDTFVYLAKRDNFECVPESLRTPLGELSFVLEVALTPERKLARENVETVRQNLVAHGFHLQFPPKIFNLDAGADGRVNG